MAGGFIERTILHTASTIRESVFNDNIASNKGLLQERDPRFKLLSALVVLTAVLLSRSTAELALMYSVIIFLVIFSRIRMSYFLMRTLPFIPFFSLLIVLPAILNIVTPGEAVVSFRVFGHHLSITRQGIDSASIFLMRVLVSVSLSVLLVLTTRHQALLKTLRIFRVPQVFVMTFGMCYRYIYLMLDVVMNTFMAIKSRVGFVTSSKTGRRIVGMNMGNLWLKSYRLHTQVYEAMISRGYQGEPRVLSDFTSGPIDFLMLAVSLFILIGTLWLNRCLP
jgi:cobalt/nickel transport system permease protein